MRSKKSYRSPAAAAGDNDRYVVRVETGWAMKKPSSDRAQRCYRTQAEAERAARDIVRRSGGGEVWVQDRNGRWRASLLIGRAGFAKISAVEGIRLSGQMQREFRTFERKGVSDEQRRRTILSKYGGKR